MNLSLFLLFMLRCWSPGLIKEPGLRSVLVEVGIGSLAKVFLPCVQVFTQFGQKSICSVCLPINIPLHHIEVVQAPGVCPHQTYRTTPPQKSSVCTQRQTRCVICWFYCSWVHIRRTERGFYRSRWSKHVMGVWDSTCLDESVFPLSHEFESSMILSRWISPALFPSRLPSYS